MSAMLNTATRPNWLRKSVIKSLIAYQQTQQSGAELIEDEVGFFLYDLDYLAQHLSGLMQQDVIKLWFAVKANPLSRVISTLAQQGFNFDVASQGELKIGRASCRERV